MGSFGGKYVVRYLSPGAGLDAGFVAHTSNTLPADYELVQKPLSIAWGGTFIAFLLPLSSPTALLALQLIET